MMTELFELGAAACNGQAVREIAIDNLTHDVVDGSDAATDVGI
jgi:hypothetical protein